MWGGHTSRYHREFSETYRCFPVSSLPGNERENVIYGGKILLPPSALSKLASLNISYPMLFELHNDLKATHTHAGVLEFIAEEGRVYVPSWMMQTLSLEPGQLVHIKNATLPLGKFVKIQPQSVDFLDISDPKAVLEQALRNFSTLTVGDVITIKYNTKLYNILVMETRPEGKGISIVETDLEVDFAPPLGYKEPERPKESYAYQKSMTNIKDYTLGEQEKFTVFKGQGTRLSGKKDSIASYSQSTSKDVNEAEATVPGILKLPPGKFYFGYPVKPLKKKDETVKENVFEGQGTSLREARLNKK